MWKRILTALAIWNGALIGLELAARIAYNPSSSGWFAGVFIGLPIGMFAGFCLGRTIDRKGGIRMLSAPLRFLFLVCLVVLIVADLGFFLLPFTFDD